MYIHRRLKATYHYYKEKKLFPCFIMSFEVVTTVSMNINFGN
jgi:hypothetical protein